MLDNHDTLLIKREAETSERCGYVPEKRPITELMTYGMAVINKPSGPTSHQVADVVKKMLGVSRAGHSGTLE